MRLLLDTHIALWTIADAPQLPSRARALVVDPDNQIWVSAATVWEISIKHGIDAQAMPLSGTQALHWFRVSGYQELSISPGHAAAVDSLPAIHGDPFDRILVAQAETEPIKLVTRDKILARYSELVLLV